MMGFRYTMSFQPVIPISLNKNWNLISRTILPIIHQDIIIGRTSQTGLGDIVQGFFISPNFSELLPGAEMKEEEEKIALSEAQTQETESFVRAG
jgi:hypothetical protein